MPRTPSAADKAVFAHLAPALNHSRDLHSITDPETGTQIDVVAARDYPAAGLIVLASIGLNDLENHLELGDAPLRIELMTSVASEFKDDATAALLNVARIMKSKNVQLQPGTAVRDVFVASPEQPLTTPHGLLWHMGMWTDEVSALHLEDRVVAWMTLIPITQDEFDAMLPGGDNLMDAFDSPDVDLFDLTRASALL